MQLLCLSADDLARALPMEEAIDAARRAYASLARGTALAPPRCVLKAPGPRGTTLVMGGSVSGAGLVAKLVTVNPENPARGLPGTVGLVVVAYRSRIAHRGLLCSLASRWQFHLRVDHSPADPY